MEKNIFYAKNKKLKKKQNNKRPIICQRTTQSNRKGENFQI